VIIARDHAVEPREHRMSGVGDVPMPCYIVGHLGRGRVVVNHVWPTKEPIVSYRAAHQICLNLNVSREAYFLDLIRCLARSTQA
jgi:hypothetical protein